MEFGEKFFDTLAPHKFKMHVTRRNVLQHVQCRTCKLLFLQQTALPYCN